jgi:mono/diheme cytochrome c family protein
MLSLPFHFRQVLLLSCLKICVYGFYAASTRADQADPINAQFQELFVRRVAPLFEAKCLACHGKDDSNIKGGLDMRSLSGLLKGVDRKSPAVVVGKAEERPVHLATTRSHDAWSAMPPKDADKLYKEQLDCPKNWITGGAPWPNGSDFQAIATSNTKKWNAEDGMIVKTIGALSEAWANRRYKREGLWAYKEVPQFKDDQRSGSDHIDALIAGRTSSGIEVALPADRTTLIRRTTFDLLGLPPSPNEVEIFHKDPRSDKIAFSSVIERLFASPHYGGRMAQHWLVVVRYADSSGFVNDFERGNAWRYRDYVVNSFNSDKPYDQFLRQQIAGDEIDSSNPALIIATSFLRTGPWELTGMHVAKIARQRVLDDAVNIAGETFIANSLQCARCHDHKFDHVPTHDYYSIQAVFATTQLVERKAPFLGRENIEGFEEQKYLELRRVEYKSMLALLDAKLLEFAQAWYRKQRLSPNKWNKAIVVLAKKAADSDRNTNTNVKRLDFPDRFSSARSLLLKEGGSENEFPPIHVGFTPQDYVNERIARRRLERIKWGLERYEPYAHAVYAGRTPQLTAVHNPLRVPKQTIQDGDLEETCILNGGDPFGSGAKVKPGLLIVLGEIHNGPIPDTIDRRRKAFAEWVASKQNPLTSRPIVNRIWLRHFDHLVAGNPNNFGSTGSKPTHPKLLDWLEVSFVENHHAGRFKELNLFGGTVIEDLVS